MCTIPRSLSPELASLSDDIFQPILSCSKGGSPCVLSHALNNTCSSRPRLIAFKSSVLQIRLVFLILPSLVFIFELNMFQIISPVFPNKYKLRFSTSIFLVFVSQQCSLVPPSLVLILYFIIYTRVMDRLNICLSCFMVLEQKRQDDQ